MASKDTELSTAVRHDRALEILERCFGGLDGPALDGDRETLGSLGASPKGVGETSASLGITRFSSKICSRGTAMILRRARLARGSPL